MSKASWKWTCGLVVVAALVLLMIALAVGFAYAARSILKEHEVRFSRIQRQLERDAIALVDRLLRRDRHE